MYRPLSSLRLITTGLALIIISAFAIAANWGGDFFAHKVASSEHGVAQADLDPGPGNGPSASLPSYIRDVAADTSGLAFLTSMFSPLGGPFVPGSIQGQDGWSGGTIPILPQVDQA